MKTRSIGTFLAAFFFFSVSASAQEHSIRGKLVDEKGNPLKNANVSLLRTRNDVPFAQGAKTDSAGAFVFAAPSKGGYFLQFVVNGLPKMETDSFTVAGRSDAKDLKTIEFKAGKKGNGKNGE